MRWALFVKDVRSQMLVLIGAFLLMIAPVVIWMAVELPNRHGPADMPQRIADLRNEAATMIGIGVIVSALTFPAFAGVAGARERRERSGDFLESLPVSRVSVVVSRIAGCVVAALIVPILGLCLAYFVQTHPLREIVRPDSAEFERGLMLILAVYGGGPVLMAAIAWLAASMVRSETIAAVLGIGGMAATAFLFWQVVARINANTPVAEETWMHALAWTFGCLAVACFVGGTVTALRRRSP